MSRQLDLDQARRRPATARLPRLDQATAADPSIGRVFGDLVRLRRTRRKTYRYQAALLAVSGACFGRFAAGLVAVFSAGFGQF